MKKNLIVLLGPTGVGKTDLSIDLAKHFSTEIISSDSRQIYKELSIGTAVPSVNQLNSIKHHFIQIRSVAGYYNASMFEFEALALLENLFKEKNKVLMTGGSGMYIDAVCKGIDDIPDIDMNLRQSLTDQIEKEGIESLRMILKKLDPEFYATADLKNKQRILRAVEVCIQTGRPFSSFRVQAQKPRKFGIIKIGLNRNRDELYDRINQRVDEMIAEGLVDEARNVYPYKGAYALKTVGYKEIFDYIEDKIPLEKAVEQIKQNTRNYARRQLTWFRRDQDIRWFHPEQKDKIIEYIKRLYNQ
ncbi:MAG: tRNA (adenosine(37)-N6)-dimethylallyltransferase MiaA [Bacteroidia bacterium]|nr:tRNA (adenosine(37)-N6)-dimethylallyltransferase MiaA [Bacteroidia bacterium]